MTTASKKNLYKIYKSLDHRAYLLRCIRFVYAQCMDRDLFNVPNIDALESDINRGDLDQSKNLLDIFGEIPGLGTHTQFLCLKIIKISFEKLTLPTMKKAEFDIYRQWLQYAIKKIGYEDEESHHLFATLLEV